MSANFSTQATLTCRRPDELEPSAPGPVTALVERLVEEMNHSWRQGHCPAAADFLAQYPELTRHTESALRLVYEEVCLRQECGQVVDHGEILKRYSPWQSELAMLLNCHRLVESQTRAPRFPEPGEILGDFHLLALLGRGAHGHVFLAKQVQLADRLVVLKLTPRFGQEYLALAQLPHTHIVPLYGVQDFPERDLCGLYMPYLGGATLDKVLGAVHDRVPADRSGADLLAALDTLQRAMPGAAPAHGPVREGLAGATYVEAICWLGVRLAEALHFAHQRGLVHLDLKPNNVLLAADGQPLLLDFHLARAPLAAGAVAPDWLGGTPGYMAPEHADAFVAVQEGRPLATAVDGRADVYGLGLVLYQALGGPHDRPAPGCSLCWYNPRVSGGLARILDRCLAADPAQRYPTAAALADDLERSLRGDVLRGVRQPWPEHWQSWRRRWVPTLQRLGLVAALLGVCLVVLIGTAVSRKRQRNLAEQALQEGIQELGHGRPEPAATAFRRALTHTSDLFGSTPLQRQLHEYLAQAEGLRTARKLRRLVDQLRFRYLPETLPLVSKRALQAPCRAFWDKRHLLLQAGAAASDADIERGIRADLLDLAILWADLHIQLAEPGTEAAARREVLELLREAEGLLGPSFVLRAECQRLTGTDDTASPTSLGHTAWDHYTVGRTQLRLGHFTAAVAHLERAVDLEPEGFWPNFYHGVCAHRLQRCEDAVRSFSVCVALAPRSAACFFNRGLALAELDELERATRDYDRALQLDPTLAAAALNRGLLQYRAGRCVQALADLDYALKQGADPATVHYNRAVVYQARGDRAAALDSVTLALRHHPTHRAAAELRSYLLQEQ